MIFLENRKRLAWLRTTLQEVKGHTSKGTFRESKRSKRYYGYATYIMKLIEAKPSSYEDASSRMEERVAGRILVNYEE